MAHDIVTKKDVALKVTILARDTVDPESTIYIEIRQRVQNRLGDIPPWNVPRNVPAGIDWY